MSWVAVAVAGAGVVGAVVGSNASQNAADTQANAADNATALQKYQYDQTRTDQQPYRDAGYGALGKLQSLLGLSGDKTAPGYGQLSTPFTGANVTSDPGYAFGLQQGTLGANRAANAAGRQYSGATLKALARYSNDYATTKFDDAFNRNQVQNNNLFNQLSGVSGTGQVATNQVGAAGQNYANNAGNIGIGAANAGAANSINQGNIWGNALNQGVSAWQKFTGGGIGGGMSANDPYGYGVNAGGGGADGWKFTG